MAVACLAGVKLGILVIINVFLVPSTLVHRCFASHRSDVGPVDCTVDLLVEFISSQMTSDDGSTRRLRGPYLAQLELMRRLKGRHDNRWSTVFGAYF